MSHHVVELLLVPILPTLEVGLGQLDLLLDFNKALQRCLRFIFGLGGETSEDFGGFIVDQRLHVRRNGLLLGISCQKFGVLVLGLRFVIATFHFALTIFELRYFSLLYFF